MPNRRFLLTLSILSLSAPMSLAEPPVYLPEFLGPASGANALNESGLVVGNTTWFGAIRAYVASTNEGVELLPLPQGFVSSRAEDINEAGVVVGVVSPNNFPFQFGEAAKWAPDGQGGHVATRLGMLPGHVRSEATALNDIGDIVGFSSDGTFRYPVLFTSDGRVVDLSATGIFDPQDVNNDRVVVDHSFTAKRLDLDTMIVEDLGVPQGNYLATRAIVINSRNQVGGAAILTTSGNCSDEAARFTDGAGWEILSGCGRSNSVRDMNDRGDAVMQLNVHPFVRLEGEGTFQIEQLIRQDVGHWYLVNSFAMAINNAGQIAVWAHNDFTEESGLLLLTPQDTGDSAELLSVAVVTGSLLSGGVAELRESDNSAVHARSGFGRTLVDHHHMEMLVEARTTTIQPASLDLVVEGRISDAAGLAHVRLWDWAREQFIAVGTFPIGSEDNVESFFGIEAARFVGGDGMIRLSIKEVVVAPVFAYRFDSLIDQVRIAVE